MWNALDNYLSSATGKRVIVGLFLGGYLLVGGWIFDDYGISFDEDYSRRNGIVNYNYILKRDNFAALHDYSDKYYGPAFNILLVCIEDKLPAHSSKTLYLVRHFVTFLTFYAGVWFFYLLGKERFRSWKAGLLGSLLLILSPRVFADSFYNPKDLPFLSLFIISIYTLLRYLQTKSWRWILLHALVCGVLVDIRVMGILVPALTCLFGLADVLIGTTHPKVSPQRGIVSVLLYSLVFMGFTILLFPVLWENPFYHFTQAFLHMKQYPWPGTVLYLGEYIKATQLPWHYAPVWIGITTPLAYLVFGLGGVGLTIISLIRRASAWYKEKSCRYDVIFLLWACCPLVAVIIFKSVLYDGWRHLFFLYPALILFAIRGVSDTSSWVKKVFKGWKASAGRVLLVVLLIIGILDPLVFMIQYHPHQNVYFNRLAGRDMRVVKDRFELDYWGLSFRQAFEYIVAHDSRDRIKVFAEAWTVNAEMLPEEDKIRLQFVSTPDTAEYFVSHYRYHKEDYAYEHEVFSIDIRRAKIMVVYQLSSNHTSADSPVRTILRSATASLQRGAAAT